MVLLYNICIDFEIRGYVMESRQLVVVSEVDNLEFLKLHGFSPVEFYTDVNMFKKKSIFFNNAIVLFITQGNCYFSRKQLLDLYNHMVSRAEDDSDTGVYDALLLSDTVIPTCKDYLYYEDYPLAVTRYGGRFAKSKALDLLKMLEYDASPTTVRYLKDSDYGFNDSALELVRSPREQEEELISKIKIPDIV